MTKRRQQIATTIVAVLVIAATGSIAGYASQETETTTAEATPINSCQTIDEPGRYVLASDIENSSANVCLDIQSSDVHLDGQGYTIDGTLSRERIREIYRENPQGPPLRHIGLAVNLNGSEPVTNVSITDVTTTDWLLGIVGMQVSDATIRGITSQSTGGGLWIVSATNTRVTSSNLSDNVAIGVGVLSGRNNSIEDVTANQNGQTGVGLGGSESVARNITATGNGLVGLGVSGSPNRTAKQVTVTDANLRENGYSGLGVHYTTDLTVTDTVVAGTQGTFPEFIPTNPPLPSTGIHVINASGNEFRDIDARDQASWAYFAANSSTNVVQNLSTDAGVISFEAQDIGLAPTATAPVDASAANATTIHDDWLVLNTSTDAFIDSDDPLETTTTMEEAANETTTTAEIVRPVA